jgi:hypothetical protein
MEPSFMDNTTKIRRVSIALRFACLIYLICSPLLTLGIWLNFEQLGANTEPFSNLPLQMEYIGPVNLILGFLVSCLPMGIMMYGVWRLRLLFGLYRTGALFTPAIACHIQVFAAMLMLKVVTSPIVDIFLSLFLTMNNPAGERSISISLGSDDLSVLFLSGVMFAVAWIMREGQRLAEENAEFI